MAAIEFSQEQAMMLDIAGKFFRDRWPSDKVRELMTTESGYDADLWTEIAELGWLGMAVPEEAGGAGLGPAALVPIAERMGRHLFASPFLSTQLAIQGLVHGGSAEQRAAWLGRLGEGAVGTVAWAEPDGAWDLTKPASTAEAKGSRVLLHGEKCFVADAGVADLFLITVQWQGEAALAVVAKEELSDGALERETVIDETKRSYRLSLEGLEIAESALIDDQAAAAALRAVRDTAWLLLAAEACGGTAGVLDVLLEYLQNRKQFGRLIGGFQALKHPTVDILVGLERARSHLYHSATVFGEQAEVALRMAKADACEAFSFAGDRAIQFHGGVGFTWECDAQLYLRRALWCQYQFGDGLHHRQRLAELVL